MAKNLDWGWGIRGGKKMHHSLCFPKLNQCRNSNWNLPIFFPYKFHIKNIEMLLSLVKNKTKLLFNGKTSQRKYVIQLFLGWQFFALVDNNHGLEKLRSCSVCSDLRNIPPAARYQAAVLRGYKHQQRSLLFSSSIS